MSAKAKIVVVDDDATMREALRETLAGEDFIGDRLQMLVVECDFAHCESAGTLGLNVDLALD